MVTWNVDPGSSEPLFLQIVNRVKQAVATGALKPGDRLPSVRELARELVINPNTIARAFREKFGGDSMREVRGAYDRYLDLARRLREPGADPEQQQAEALS